MYVNGVANYSGTARVELNAAELAVGNDVYRDQPWDGDIDEVHIYSGALSSTQVYNLYMKNPSFTPRTTNTITPDLRGTAPDSQMTIWLTIDNKDYDAINNQNGTWQALHIGPLSTGYHDIYLNYMNVYGKTGVIYYQS